jgi:PAS domain S-box-containing protein
MRDVASRTPSTDKRSNSGDSRMKPRLNEAGSTPKVPLRVLCFEDHPLDVELAIRTLNSEEFCAEVDVAVTIDEVIRRASSKIYDVILSDYRMPDATGMDAFQGLRARDIDIPFILVTGSLGDEQAVECLKEGVADYVLKDRLARLPVAVRRALDEKRRKQERAEAEASLRRSEASYRSLIQSAPCGILRIGAEDGRFLEVNAAMAQMLGYDSPAELLANASSRQPTLSEIRLPLIQHYQQYGRIPETDVDWGCKDGSVIRVRLSGRLLQDSSGAATHFELIAENITQRERAQERIRQLNRLYSVSTHVSQAIVRIRDRDELFRRICEIAVDEGRFRMAWIGAIDPATDLLKAVSDAGFVDGFLEEIGMSRDNGSSAMGVIGEALENGTHFICDDIHTSFGFEQWREPALRRGYGSMGGFPVTVHGHLVAALSLYASEPGVFDAENVALLDKMADDVSFALESMDMAELRQRAVDELNQFFALSPDMLGIASLQGQIRRLNVTWEKSLGISVAELSRRPLLELVDPNDRAQALAAARKLQDGEEVDGVELRFNTPDGGCRWLIFNATPVPQQGLVFVAARDISDRKCLEEWLRQQNVQLAESKQRVLAANRMKSEFLANMSHELRSPLNGMIGFSQLLFDGKLGPISGQQKDVIERVLKSSEHLLHLINGVLDLSKVEAGRFEFHPEPLSTRDLVHEVTGALGATAEAKRIRLESVVAPDVQTVVADAARLKQVLYNYLSNALKFTGENGRVAVNLRAEGSAEFCLEVIDSGVGIAPEDISRIFVEFQQLDSGKAKRFQGTGLGLALTKRIVEAQGGRVGVKSTPGEGSTFFAILPRDPRQGMPLVATPEPCEKIPEEHYAGAGAPSAKA